MAVTEKKRRNYELGTSGIMRFSRSRMFAKRAVYRKKKPDQTKAVTKKRAETYVEKQIGGEKNGGTRKVPVKRAVSCKSMK